MKNLTQKIILAISLLGFVTLTACGQTENTQKQEKKTTKTEEVVKKDTNQLKFKEENSDNPFAGFNLADHPEMTVQKWNTLSTEEKADFARSKKNKPVIVATETSKVSLGAEQADDDLFSSNATDDLAAAKTRIETKRINAAANKEGLKKDLTENEKLKLEREKLQKQVSELTGAKGELDTRYSIPTLTPDEQSDLAQSKFGKTPEQLDKEIKAGKYGKIKNEDGSDFGVSDFLAFVSFCK